MKLDDKTLAALLPSIPLWTLHPARGGLLTREFIFGDFEQAFAFMTQVAALADARDHHPEWSNVYNRVAVTLTTHDVEGVSMNDIDMAIEMDRMASGSVDGNQRQQPTVMVTGAAGHLGKAVAAAFLSQGARLLLLDRDLAALERIHEPSPRITLLGVDLLDRDRVQAEVAAALQRCGHLHVLCHIAGGFRMGEAVHETTPQTWDFLNDLNARSFIHIASAAVPHLIERRGGRIVTVGAGAALKGAAYMGAYAASKSALMRLTESMSAELRGHGIKVNCVLPSILDTPDNRSAMPSADASHWVTPQALAEVIAFLGSDAARAIHGACIPVTGLV